MKENIKQMRARHKKEIIKLQSECEHKSLERMPYMWAPGHFGNDVDVCKKCGRIFQTYNDRVGEGSQGGS